VLGWRTHRTSSRTDPAVYVRERRAGPPTGHAALLLRRSAAPRRCTTVSTSRRQHRWNVLCHGPGHARHRQPCQVTHIRVVVTSPFMLAYSQYLGSLKFFVCLFVYLFFFLSLSLSFSFALSPSVSTIGRKLRTCLKPRLFN